MAPKPTIDRRLQRLASAFTPEWLAGQRWYRGKSRGLTSVDLVDAAEVSGSSGWLLILEATDSSGGHASYLVPAVISDDSFREPRDGDGVWSSLAALMLAGGDVAGTRGHWTFGPTDASSVLLAGGPATLDADAERRLGVQQSNTSVALGEVLMLKLYRLVEPGSNPEIEMNAFLTEVGFRDAPAMAGSATYLLDGVPHSAAMLQQLVASQGDAWSWMLERLGDAADGPAEAIRALAEIGRLTAEMHVALASHPENAGFPSRLATREELSAWRAAAEGQLEGAISVLDGTMRARLAPLAPVLATRLGAIEMSRAVRVSRIHGDYHLGQLLRTPGGFAVIDFEGEPARTLDERRAAASPLRDLAGMLRSLDYASQVATANAPRQAADWLVDARASFLSGYGGIRLGEASLLAAFELEKACYEVVYEANNRPDWVWLPLGALERQLQAG